MPVCVGAQDQDLQIEVFWRLPDLTPDRAARIKEKSYALFSMPIVEDLCQQLRCHYRTQAPKGERRSGEIAPDEFIGDYFYSCFLGGLVTYLDVIDTAVKVGLGALISGISTFWMTNAKNRDDIRRERLQRHQGLLEKSSEQIEIFSHALLRYWALIVECVRIREQGNDLSRKKSDELTKTKADLFDSFSELTSAESKLLLLGHTDAQMLLREIGDLAKKIRRHAWQGNQKLTESEMEEFRAQFLIARQKLFDALSTIYRKES